MGMHLKEYTYRELAVKLKLAGFKSVRSKIPDSIKIERILGKVYKSNVAHAIYLNYLCWVESLIKILPTQEMRRKAVGKAANSFKFAQQIVMIAEKKAN